MDPATATLVTTLGSSFLQSIFAPPQQPQLSQAQIAAILEQRRQQEAATQRNWLIGGGLAAVALVAYLMLSRK